MTARIVYFLLATGGAALLAWLLWSSAVVTLSVALVVAILFFIWDSWQGQRLINALRHGRGLSIAVHHGLWADVAARWGQVQKRHAQKLGASEAKHQSFLDAIQHSPYGVVMLNAQDQIEWCNATVEQHLGLQMPRDEGQVMGNLVRSPAFTQVLSTDNPAQSTVLNGVRGDLAHPERIAVHVHPHGAGRKLVFTRDVTALEQAEAMRRDFVANVSHEMRTPLTVLLGFVETLQTLPLPREQQMRYFGLMGTQAERMRTLVDDLLILSKLESTSHPAETTWLPVRDVLHGLVQEAEHLSATLHGDGVQGPHRVESSCEPSALQWDMAASEMHSAFSNLVSNAIRYTPKGGRVHIGFMLDVDGRSTFSVTDSGDGIAPEHLPRLTERFYRVDRSRSRETGGTGLGLAIVKHVVQRHSGELKLESKLGVGSRFAIVFPAQRVRVPEQGV